MTKILLTLIATVMLTTTVNAQEVWASWYKHGHTTANGERYNPHGLTAAHRTLPFGTKVRVTYRGKSIIVRINDRGPFIKGRSIDLAMGAARAIGCKGVCKVKMQVLGKKGA